MSEELEQFWGTAERYCALVESLEELSRHEFLARLNLALPELYLAALRLPTRFEDDEDPPEGISDEESWNLFQRVQSKLGDADSYVVIFDPWDKAEEPAVASLADDVANIYRDLKAVLADERAERSAWDWRFAFTNHWGHHATNALNATHWLLHSSAHWIDPDE